jgi:predicted MPP superfamily phosphohydrolase
MSSHPATSTPPPKQATRAIGLRPRLVTFLRVLLVITIINQVPFAAAVAEFGRRVGWRAPWLIAAAAAALGVVLFLLRMRAGMPDKRRSTLGLRLIDIPFYVHWCACLFTIIPAILATIVVPIIALAQGQPPRAPMGFYMWTYLLGLVVCGYGILVRRRWFVVREVDVPVQGLDPSLDGFRIAHLSDLHIGTNTPRRWGERWVRAANRRLPDLAVVTGDMVSSGSEYHGDIAEMVAGLSAKHGVFVTMGNHDYFGEGEPLVSMLGERGVRVLRNEGVVIDHGGKPLFLAGIDDTWTRRDDLTQALRDRPDSTPTILLAHDPERFRQAAKMNVELTLSGHTHGGQIAFPFLSKWISLSHLTHHFHQGLYRKGGASLYVHPGLGTTGPPMRLGVAPAVVILTLRAVWS